MLNITDIYVILVINETLHLENNSQARILLALLRARRSTERSQSGYDLQKNYEIPNSTWSDNYQKLEKNLLIKQDVENSRKEKKKKNSKKKTKPKYSYLITGLGIFLLLDYLLEKDFDLLSHQAKEKKNSKSYNQNQEVFSILNLKKSDVNSFYEFIPLIWDNSKELENIFEEKSITKGILKSIFQLSNNQIKIFKINSIIADHFYLGGEIEIYPEKNSSNSFVLRKPLTNFQNEFQGRTVFEYLTFLFYFNLFKLCKQDRRVSSPYIIDKQIIPDTEELENMFRHEKFESAMQAGKKIYNLPHEKIFKIMVKNESKLITLIEQDKALQELMQNIFKEISESINSKSLLLEAQSEFHNL